MLQKTNIQGFVKDTESNVIINDNLSEYQLYLQNKNRVQQTKSIQKDIDNLKKEFAEIKSMFNQLLNGKTNV